jgi:uncharacterized membrane protein
MRAIPFGIAIGVVSGLGVLVATVRAVQIHGGNTLILLRKFFPGYTISPAGCAIGMVWGFVYGFLAGAAVAVLYNYFVRALEPRDR